MEGKESAGVPRAAGWAALALVVFGVALAVAYQGHWGSDFRVSVPIPTSTLVERGNAVRRVGPTTLNDYRMGVWAFSRHAYTLLQDPRRIFQTEPCHPVENGLAYHHPVITQGLVAVPGYLASGGDPVATTNVLILSSALLGAGAMALLVASWTALPAAGVVAGLLYAFHPAQIGSPFHLGTKDFTWTLLALFFAWRLFARRRWRDALGLGLCGALQLGTSFYPMLAAVTLAIPIGVWLVWHHGWRQLPASRLTAVALVVAGAACWILGPYLELREAGSLERSVRFFAPWSRFAPGGELFPGWTCLLLLGAALALGRKRALGGMSGDPRPALGIGLLLLILLATGGNVAARVAALNTGEPPPLALPNLFAIAQGLVPGLDTVRLPSMLAHGARMLLCVLAGLGAASLLRLTPQRLAPFAAGLLILVAAVDTLRPAFLRLQPPIVFESLDIRPDAETLRFFEQLAAADNRGPMLELPIGTATTYQQSPLQHLLTTYHHRRTSGCSPSITPQRVRELAPLSRRLGEPGVLDEVRALGFTTLVVHHSGARRAAKRYAEQIRRIARLSEGELVEILSTESMTAYELREP